MFDRLIEILQSQLSLFSELLELSRQKKAYLVKNDIEGIRRLTACENSLIGKLQRLERERVSMVSDLAKRLNVSITGLTLTKLAESAREPQVKKQLGCLRVQLRSQMDELKSVNEQNKTLINHSLEYIDFTMNLLRNTVSGPVYAGDEEIHGQVFFDARG